MKTITFVCTIVHVIELTPAQIPLVKKDMEEQSEGAVQ